MLRLASFVAPGVSLQAPEGSSVRLKNRVMHQRRLVVCRRPADSSFTKTMSDIRNTVVDTEYAQVHMMELMDMTDCNDTDYVITCC